jgi:hypothetical protein
VRAGAPERACSEHSRALSVMGKAAVLLGLRDSLPVAAAAAATATPSTSQRAARAFSSSPPRTHSNTAGTANAHVARPRRASDTGKRVRSARRVCAWCAVRACDANASVGARVGECVVVSIDVDVVERSGATISRHA